MPTETWLVTQLIILLCFLGLGKALASQFFGILIDEQNKISISRFQVVIWTFLLVSALAALAIEYRTLDIEVNEQLWQLMGVSLASLGISTAIQSNQRKQVRADSSVHATVASSVSDSILFANSSATQASWKDLFTGDEKEDHKYVDISKVQMFMFTVIAWVGYYWAILGMQVECKKPAGQVGGSMAASAEACVPIDLAFPELSAGILTLILVSHSGFNLAKAFPKTPIK